MNRMSVTRINRLIEQIDRALEVLADDDGASATYATLEEVREQIHEARQRDGQQAHREYLDRYAATARLDAEIDARMRAVYKDDPDAG